MEIFGHLFGGVGADNPALMAAIEQAIVRVEPRLKEAHGYPGAYKKPVLTALDYAHSLAASVPGPVEINLESYAQDPFVHAIFPSMEYVSEAFQNSRAIQDYLGSHSAGDEVYALMGMRRWEKNTLGMEAVGQIIHRDVPQQMVFFTSHTIVHPAPTEALARAEAAQAFFNNLADKVARQLASQKQETREQLIELDALKARLRAADTALRPALEKKLAALLADIQASARATDLRHYAEHFEAVLQNPEQHLRLKQSVMVLDSMGIKRSDGADAASEPVVFNDLIGFDRRDWTVTMTRCRDIKVESFAERLESAYRTLSL
jgi:hypothetical protein